MNKLLYYMRNILILILIFFHLRFISIHGLISFKFIIYLLLFIIFIIIHVKDFLNKDLFNEDRRYNLLLLFVTLLMSFIFIRSLYDINLPYNNLEVRKAVELLSANSMEEIKLISMLYLYQNIIYFIILLLALLFYRKLNKKEFKDSKYSGVSITCFFTSFLMIPFLISAFGTNSIYFYLILNTILLILEIYHLIKDNHKKREWIIYVSFLGNLFSFILILASIL